MQKRKHYTKDFKIEAVRLFDSGDIPASDLARQLGIRRNQLYKWKAELADKGPEAVFKGPGRNTALDEQSKRTQLKRKVAQLEEENAILKKAAAYFAREVRLPAPRLRPGPRPAGPVPSADFFEQSPGWVMGFGLAVWSIALEKLRSRLCTSA